MAKQTKPPAPPPEPEIAPVARSEWLVVGALYAIAVLVYVLLARDQPVPLVTPDEYTYGGAARSLAGGDGLTILGEPVDLRAALYVYLIAPAWWLGSATGAYDLAKAIGVAAVCLTLVPVWWLTRQYAGRWVALVPAVLIVAGTWMTSAASLLTENVALPLAAASLTGAVMALRRPGSPWIWWALGLAALATWSRLQVGVLFAVILAALLLDAFLLRAAEERRARLRAQRVPLIALGALLVLGAIVTLAAGQSTLGFYDTVKDFSPSLADVAEQIGRQWLALTVMTAIVPMALAVAAAATPAAWRDEDRLRPLLAVGLSAAVLFILQSAWFNAGVGAPHAIQRYVVYAVPLLLVITTVVAVARVVPIRTALIAGGAVVLLGFLTPEVAKVIEERGIYGLWLRFGDALGASAGVAVGLVGILAVGAAIAALWRLRPPAAASAIGAVMLVVLAIQSQAGWTWQLDLAKAFAAQYPSLTWLDERTDPGVTRLFGFGNSPLTDNMVFFNEHAVQTLTPATQFIGAAPRGRTCTWSIDDDGAMRIEPPCNRTPRELWNNDPILRLAFANGRPVASDRLLGQVFRMQGPPRVEAALVLPCTAATLAISEDGTEFGPPAPSEVTCTTAITASTWLPGDGELVLRLRGGRDAHRLQADGEVVEIPAGERVTVRVPVPKGPARTEIPTDWTSEDGAPVIEAITLEQDGRSVPLV